MFALIRPVLRVVGGFAGVRSAQGAYAASDSDILVLTEAFEIRDRDVDGKLEQMISATNENYQ